MHGRGAGHLIVVVYAPRYEKWPGTDYVECLRLVKQSCEAVGQRLMVVTDAELPGDLPQWHADLPQNLMAALTSGIEQYRRATEGRLFFTGADCLLTRDPFRFAKDCDAAFTFGPFKDCPLNTGAMWLNTRASADLYAKALASKPAKWGEDQTSLLAAVEASPLKIERLQCSDHNSAPGGPGDIIDTTIVHFRGPRKGWMAEWWRNHQRQQPQFIVKG